MKTKTKFRYLALGNLIIIFGVLVISINFETMAQINDCKNNKPNVQISVKKQTDKNGNITSYDSTYISTWSGNNINPDERDSIFQNIEKQFQDKQYGNNSFGIDSAFSLNNDFLDNDSLFFGDIFDSHFYEYHNNVMKEMEEMMRKNEALFEHFFNTIPNNNKPLFKTPEDSISSQPQPQPKVLPQQENYNKGIEL